MATLNVRQLTPGALAGARAPAARTLLLAICALFLNACTVAPQVRSLVVNQNLVSEAGGDVQLIRDGAPVPLSAGTELEAGDEIVTGPNAQALLLLENGKVEVIVFENSRVRYSSIFLGIGEVYVRIKSKVQEWTGVESEYIAATQERTEFFVRVGPNDEYTCEVLEGRVVARSKRGQWPQVTIDAREQMTASPPTATAPQAQRMSDREFNALVKRVNAIERIFRPTAAELMVPDVVGLAENDAQKRLLEHGFKRGDITGVVTRQRNVGEVVTQSPVAGERIRPGATVGLEVEVEPTTVPNVVGSTLDDAQRIIARAQLKVGNVSEQLEVGADSGIVRSQSIAARGEVAPGTAIDLVVSEAASEVPRLTGRTREQAASDLRKANLKLGSVRSRPSREAVNTIIDQNPDSGTLVKAGSEVDIVLAEQCTVPNVIGMSRNDAVARVQDAELTARVYTVNGANTELETVHQQNPRAGTKQNCGSHVEIGLGYWTVQ